MKETISNRLKQIMAQRNLKQVDILNMSAPLQRKYNIRLAKNDLSQYVNGKVEPNQDRIFLLSKTLNVSEAWLLGYNVPQEVVDKEDNTNELVSIYNKLVQERKNNVYQYATEQLVEQNNVLKFPDGKQIIRGRQTAAGSALYSDDDEAHMEVLSASMVPRGADELVEVVGKSMEPLIKDGEDVYIRHQPQVENGEIAIVRIEGDGVTCKRFYVDGDTITLKSENPEYEDMHFDPSQVTVLGKVLL